jgi:hypothetical protein
VAVAEHAAQFGTPTKLVVLVVTEVVFEPVHEKQVAPKKAYPVAQALQTTAFKVAVAVGEMVQAVHPAVVKVAVPPTDGAVVPVQSTQAPLFGLKAHFP